MSGTDRRSSHFRVKAVVAAVASLLALLAAVVGTAQSAAGTAPVEETIFGNTVPAVASTGDAASVELGVAFVPQVNGSVNAVRFYKGAGNSGVHTGSLWNAAGSRLATASLSSETASGWQVIRFANAVSVTKGQRYVASYHAPQGHYAAAGRFFTTAYTRGDLTVPVNGGVYRYGASAYPTSTYNSTNYYVDLAFTPAVSATPTPTVQPTSASPSPTATPTGTTSKLIFGIGDNVYGAPATRMVKEAPVKMITSWYSGTDTLAETLNATSQVAKTYAAGFDQHLVVWLQQNPKATVQTKYGAACGISYPISTRFADDMRQIAQEYAPPAGRKLYVSMFFEVQVYGCQEQQWNGNEAYFAALKDSYRTALTTFHTSAPGSKVALGWGGWQVNWDDPATGAGVSMIDHFGDIMRASDFQSFGSLSETRGENLSQITKFTPLLHSYGGKVMLSPFGRYIGSDMTYWPEDLRTVLTDSVMTRLLADGLFAVDLYRQDNYTDETTFQYAKAAVQKYATWSVPAG